MSGQEHVPAYRYSVANLGTSSGLVRGGSVTSCVLDRIFFCVEDRMGLTVSRALMRAGPRRLVTLRGEKSLCWHSDVTESSGRVPDVQSSASRRGCEPEQLVVPQQLSCTLAFAPDCAELSPLVALGRTRGENVALVTLCHERLQRDATGDNTGTRCCESSVASATPFSDQLDLSSIFSPGVLLDEARHTGELDSQSVDLGALSL